MRGEDLDPAWGKGQRGHEASTPHPQLEALAWKSTLEGSGVEALEWAHVGAGRRLGKGVAAGQNGAHR